MLQAPSDKCLAMSKFLSLMLQKVPFAFRLPSLPPFLCIIAEKNERNENGDGAMRGAKADCRMDGGGDQGRVVDGLLFLGCVIPS